MIFPDIKGNEKLKNALQRLDTANRMPHAVIIGGGNSGDRHKVAVHLSMWAVCSSDNSPCGECKDCQNAAAMAHCDIYFAQGSGKTDIFSKDEIIKIISDSYIKPNQAQRKVYIFEECDVRLPVISQNVLLKTLEEPPQDVMFILTCDNPRSLLDTVRSRAVGFELESAAALSPEELECAREIALSLTETSELRLLRALYRLKKRDQANNVLGALIALFRDGMALSVGAQPKLDRETAEIMCRRLTKKQYLKLIELTQQARNNILSNVRPELIGVWLCGEYRRILWQR